MGIGAAIGGSALLGAFSSSRSSKAQSQAAQQSSDAQVLASRVSADAMTAANDKNIQFQREIFSQQRADAAPWRDIGAQALTKLQQGVQAGRFTPGEFTFDFNFNPNVDLEADPGYQFRRQEGINALDASAAARGRLQSGAQARAVSRYGSDLASQEYGAAYNRAYGAETDRYNREMQNALNTYQLNAGNREQQFNQLASLANVGQVANQQTAAARGQMAQSVGQSTTATGNAIAQGALQTGNALAQGAINQGNARASGYQGMAQAGQQGLQNYLLYNMLG